MLGAQASGAQVEPFSLTIYSKSRWVNIRHPATISTAFRMTDIVSKLG